MKTRLNGIIVCKPVNLGFGRTGWECFDPDCAALATTLYHSHGGAVERACGAHGGVCHSACWPQPDEPERGALSPSRR